MIFRVWSKNHIPHDKKQILEDFFSHLRSKNGKLSFQHHIVKSREVYYGTIDINKHIVISSGPYTVTIYPEVHGGENIRFQKKILFVPFSITKHLEIIDKIFNKKYPVEKFPCNKIVYNQKAQSLSFIGVNILDHIIDIVFILKDSSLLEMHVINSNKVELIVSNIRKIH